MGFRHFRNEVLIVFLVLISKKGTGAYVKFSAASWR